MTPAGESWSRHQPHWWTPADLSWRDEVIQQSTCIMRLAPVQVYKCFLRHLSSVTDKHIKIALHIFPYLLYRLSSFPLLGRSRHSTMALASRMSVSPLGSTKSAFRGSTKPVAHPQRSHFQQLQSRPLTAAPVRAFQVTFQTPDGDQKIECDGETRTDSRKQEDQAT